MTPRQIDNVLTWVEAMLSGKYKYGRGKLLDTQSSCVCANGVGVILFGMKNCHLEEGDKVKWPSGFASAVFVPESWFEETFGLPKTSDFYAAINDRNKGNTYFPVCMLLLDTLHTSRSVKTGLQGSRIAQLKKQLMEQANATRKA